ncbi:hypothetical protein Z043_105201 [Scleropages formosus]|uniref:Uncharacterized protein n=1 Tax=Scleropages formosus TaxID=113540 RepID=A0A0P7Z4L9_SCLFO|nr:hypothetical protein Z043_105201 [Scleropages formosus]
MTLLQGCDVNFFDKRPVSRCFGFNHTDLSSPTQVPGWPPSWQPTCPSPGQVGSQRGATFGHDEAEARQVGDPRLTALSWSPPSPPQDDSTSHSDHQDPITLAVEMAAVNHTILALSRQGGADGGGGGGNGGDIKTEVLDDD